jgi:DNA (cytosine-5)-methyltransferase 1
MNVLDLFSGIGGFSLGLERAGLRTVAFCEQDEYCQAVLGRHWPQVPCYDDVRTLTATRLAADDIRADVICGGFPCQDISEAGKRAGLDGERSGLWREYYRLICEIRPRFVIVENVAALVRRGLQTVLGDLATAGYDAEWRLLGADAIGATQHRERLWLLAYPNNSGFQGPVWAWQPDTSWPQRSPAYREPLRSDCGFWPPGPGEVIHVPRMADGPANRAHRLRALGNAVVPQIPEIIGRAIMNVKHECWLHGTNYDTDCIECYPSTDGGDHE